MKYKRLVVFGDSFTYGHGLPDCHVDPIYPGRLPSKVGWPGVLARMLKIPQVLNFSYPGASNRYITHSIIDYNDFRKDDLIFVQFTYPFRDFYFDKDSIRTSIGRWKLDPDNPEDLDEHWKFYLDRTDQELITRSFENFLLSYFLLKQNSLKFYFMSLYDFFSEVHKYIYPRDGYYVTDIKEGMDSNHSSFLINNTYKILEKHFLKDIFIKALEYSVKNKDTTADNGHFGLATNNYIAELIFNHITEESNNLRKLI